MPSRRGEVIPLPQTFALYLNVARNEEGRWVGAFRNPEFNFNGGASRFQASRSGDTVSFATPDGKIARFYELKTNTPIYFQRKKGGGDEMTYSGARPADHYGFIIDSILDDIEAEYQRVNAMPKPGGQRPVKESPAELTKAAREIISALDERGAWVQHGVKMKHNKGVPPSGVIFSEVFAKNVQTLCNSIDIGHRSPLSQ